MTEGTVEYDLPVLLDGTVDSVVAKLPDMNRATLTQLRELEDGGKTRVTLLTAIDAQIAALPPSEQTVPVNGADWPDPMDDTRKRLKVLAGALEDAGYPCGPNIDLILTAASAINELRAPASQPDAAPTAPPRATISLALTDVAEAATALKVCFAGADDVRIEDLGVLQFESADFSTGVPDGNRLLLKPIAFPLEVPAAQVLSVWLLDSMGAEWSVCRLMAPFPVGGGRSASIPAGFLSFAPPTFVQPDSAAA